jgi:hypothetical protein
VWYAHVPGAPTIPLGVHTTAPPAGLTGVRAVELTSQLGPAPRILRPYVDGSIRLTELYDRLESWLAQAF